MRRFKRTRYNSAQKINRWTLRRGLRVRRNLGLNRNSARRNDWHATFYPWTKIINMRMNGLRLRPIKYSACDHDFDQNQDQCLKCGMSIWRHAFMECP